jgi:hypothetical protein
MALSGRLGHQITDAPERRWPLDGGPTTGGAAAAAGFIGTLASGRALFQNPAI